MLDTCDKFYFTRTIPFKTILSCDSLPFNWEWLTDDDKTNWGNNYARLRLPDSMLSHPDAKHRISVLSPRINNTQITAASEEFATVKKYALLAGIEKYIDNLEYSMALYNCLQLLSDYPTEPYVILNIYRCMTEIAILKKFHFSSQAVDQPNEFFPAEYNKLLNLINNLNDKRMTLLATNFLQKNKTFLDEKDPLYIYCSVLKTLKNDDKPTSETVGKYMSLLKEDYYKHSLMRIINIIP
jgi:hypothetical protein